MIDGLNEAPNPRDVLNQVAEMIVQAGRFPWCNLAVSTRREWLGVWRDKATGVGGVTAGAGAAVPLLR